jgi:general secretion pathway protein D
MMTRRSRWLPAVLLAAVALSAAGCGARSSYRQGRKEGDKGNWDLAVARLTKALQQDPDNIQYKIALENARGQAARMHFDAARRHLAANRLEQGIEELEIATRYDPSNKMAADELLLARRAFDEREQERRRQADFEAMRGRVQAAPAPVPVLSPRSTAPITMNFPDQSLEKVFDALGKVAGVNILFDPDFRDKRVTVRLQGVTFQEALDQLTFSHRLFYKVLDRNTMIIIPESPAKRRVYDDVLLRTFYIQNAEIKEMETIVKSVLGAQARVASNPSLSALNIVGTLDQLAMAERIVQLNDKARGEVLVEVEILEVNRTKLKAYGIELSNYSASVTFAPTGVAGEVEGGLTSVRAHLLSSINLADFVVNIPSSLIARFLQTESTVKILAAPRLRASEGKPTSLRIGTEVPVPVTTFTASAPGGVGSFQPATSFQYRNVGVNLKLTPKVNASGEILLEMVAEFSLLGDDRNVGSADNPLTVPTFLTRTVEGIVRVRDGETALLGGLLSSRDSAAFRGVLGLQSIPILNRIFTGTAKNQDEQEILISITPHLVRAPKLTETDLRSLHVGTQELARVPSARPPLFGAPEEGAPVPAPPSGGGTVTTPGVPAGPASPPPAAPASPPPPAGVPEAPAPPPSEVVTPTEPAAPPAVPAGSLRPLTATLSPGEASLRVGESASVSLVLMNTRDLTGVEVVMTYDPAIIEAVEVSPGTLLTIDGSSVGVERGLEQGRVRARFTRSTGVAGSGIVAAVSFRGLRPGPAAVTVESLTLSTGTGTETSGVSGPARLIVVP